jgi:hypothetical protein
MDQADIQYESSDLDSDEMERITTAQLEADKDIVPTTSTTTISYTIMETPAICFKSIDSTVPFRLANNNEVYGIADLLDVVGFGTKSILDSEGQECLITFSAAQRAGFIVLQDTSCLIPRIDISEREAELLGFFGIHKMNTEESTDEKGRSTTEEFSRLCHVDLCCNPLHIVVEPRWVHLKRKQCEGLVFTTAFVISLEEYARVAYHSCGATPTCFRDWRPMSGKYTEYSGVPLDKVLHYQTQGLLPKNLVISDWASTYNMLKLQADTEIVRLESHVAHRKALAAAEKARLASNAIMVRCPYCFKNFRKQGIGTHKMHCKKKQAKQVDVHM